MSEEEKIRTFGDKLTELMVQDVFHANIDLDAIDEQNAEAILNEIEEYLKKHPELNGGSRNDSGV